MLLGIFAALFGVECMIGIINNSTLLFLSFVMIAPISSYAPSILGVYQILLQVFIGFSSSNILHKINFPFVFVVVISPLASAALSCLFYFFRILMNNIGFEIYNPMDEGIEAAAYRYLGIYNAMFWGVMFAIILQFRQ